MFAIRILVRNALFLALLAAMYACAVAPAPAPEAETWIQLTQDDSGGQVQLNVGQAVRISLPENPTTGYRWHVVKHDESRLELMDEEYDEPEGTVMGQGGVKHYVFAAVTPGSSVLELAYYRPWEGVEHTAEWFQLIVDAVP